MAFDSFFLLLEAVPLVEGLISASSVTAAVDFFALVFLVDRALSDVKAEGSGKVEELAVWSAKVSLLEEVVPLVLAVVDLVDRVFVFVVVARVRVVVEVAGLS